MWVNSRKTIIREDKTKQVSYWKKMKDKNKISHWKNRRKRQIDSPNTNTRPFTFTGVKLVLLAQTWEILQT